MTNADFLEKLDAAIVAGGSSGFIGALLKVNPTFVRRRRSALRKQGLLSNQNPPHEARGPHANTTD